MSMAPVELEPLVRAALDAVREDPAARPLNVGLEVQQGGLRVLADGVRVEQVVMNLLTNAVKFTPAGGNIRVQLAREGEWARLDVVDDGQGIAAGFLPHVFEMFAQPGSVTTRTKGGLGIGLALVREIVGVHGGKVEAHSDGAGKGARFSVWLPLLDAGTSGEAPGQGEQQSVAGVRILLVDDVEDVVTTCQALLEMHGALVWGATSGQQALDILKEQEVDLLVSDISMPGMDGYALLRAVRQMPRYARLPAIAVTGLAREKDIAQARESGFDAHVGKPMSVERLTDIILELLPARVQKD
jgi:two-component system CheB/CheR fusion protein